VLCPLPRIVFAGTPDFAAHHLAALLEARQQVAAVYTQPDRPAGRGKKLHASPVKLLAQEAGLPVYQPASLRDEREQARLANLGSDLVVVVAYGLILPREVLAIPALGCLNVHASLLPRWRGAAPIQRAIESGDRETGITIMQMDEGLDTGQMLARATCPIGDRTTAAELHDRLAELGAPLLLEVLGDLPRFQRQAQPQDDTLATYANKILKAEAALDWHRDAMALDRAVRAFNPFPVCFTTLGETRIRVWRARAINGSGPGGPPGTIARADREGILVDCGLGQLNIEQLQLPGGRPLSAEQVLNSHGALFSPGARFAPPVPEGE